MLGVSLEVNAESSDGSLVPVVLDIVNPIEDLQDPWIFNWLSAYIWSAEVGSPFFSFVKISLNEEILGLMQISVYPKFRPISLCTNEDPQLINIHMIETLSKRREKTVKPIGKWLLWYACKSAEIMCSGNDEGSIVELNSGNHTTSYYGDKLGMENMGESFSAFEGFTRFRFTRQKAMEFCQQLQDRYGKPRIIKLLDYM
jgi:hypothetical protein